jgi:hypothetical protein
VEVWTFVRDACVTQKHDLHIIAARDFMQKVVEIPPDSRQRLVKRTDIEADA